MTTKRSVLSIGLVAMALGLTTIGIQSSSAINTYRFASILGSWSVQFEALDDMGNPVTTLAFVTFTDGGGLVATWQGPMGISHGQGAWENRGNRQYEVRIVPFAPDMIAAGHISEIRLGIRLTPNEQWFSGEFRHITRDETAKVLESRDGIQVQAERIVLNP